LRPRTLVSFARIKPLAAWSLSGAALGTGLALYLSGWEILYPFPMALAIVAVVLMQYVAHPLNDIMDLDLDRQAPIEATGRIKPIVDGWITVRETKALSAILLIVIFAILAYLVVLQPVLIFPAAYGVFAVLGYNLSAMRLAYHPYTEYYLGIPVNAIVVTVIVYVGTGEFSPLAVVAGVAFGFAASSFFVSMMSMDYPTDAKNNKRTTVVAHPKVKWCTYFPLAGLVISLIGAIFVFQEEGAIPTLAFVALTVVCFGLLAWYGSKVDQIRLDTLAGKQLAIESKSGDLRLKQLYISSLYAASLAVTFAILGAL
jgi:1,4-dihydroxy-2-naphthoate octaprenyltransferase